MMAKKKNTGADLIRYGIGEWYGHLLPSLSVAQRREYAALGNTKLSRLPCPFRRAADPEALCNKKGGVCSLRKHKKSLDGRVSLDGPLVTLCPSRFWAENAIFAEIGEKLIGIRTPKIVKEVPFLSSVPTLQESDVIIDKDSMQADTGEEKGLGKPVGRIDTLLVDPNDPTHWCALEIQAVYFSGEGMGTHLAQYHADDDAIAFPDKNRRPDFRSSGPKRLMPQLQTKVPTLRRWGKKMAVVIDLPFLHSLGALREVKHISNSDIVWFIVDYAQEHGRLEIVKTIATTLEDSVEALTAGTPLSLEEFEADVGKILQSKRKPERKKVIDLGAIDSDRGSQA